MRAPPILTLALVLLALPVLGQAEEDPEPVRVAEDAEGDHGIHVAGQDAGSVRWAALDLLDLTVRESPGQLHLHLHVADVDAEGEQESLLDALYFDTYFSVPGRDLMVRVLLHEGTATGGLYERDPDWGWYGYLEEASVSIDAATDTMVVSLGLDQLADENGVPPRVDAPVVDFWTMSRGLVGSIVEGYTLGTVHVTDRMPDVDVGARHYLIQQGVRDAGTVAVDSPAPVRVSNGEATTFLFEVVVTNLGDRFDTVVPQIEAAPTFWTVTFPDPEVRLEAGESRTVPVLVTVPFGHQHARYHPLNVTYTSRADPLSVGQVELGVRYTRVPQPAGHHDTIHLHTAGGFVNTQEEVDVPEEEQEEQDPSWSCTFGGTENGNARLYPLWPQLKIGLDFDLTRNGTANVVLGSDLPSEGYTVGGYVVTWEGSDTPTPCLRGAPAGTVAVVERSEPVSMGQGDTVVLELDVRPTLDGDYLPYDPARRMGVVLATYDPVTVPFSGFGLTRPAFQDGTWFRLPLEEYHDPVDDHFAALSNVELVATTEQQRPVNPGETVVFSVEARAVGTQKATYLLSLDGLNSEWGRLVSAPRVTLEPGAVQEIVVAVTAPSSARHGDMADITLHAVKQGEDNVRSIIRLLAQVEEDGDLPDEAADAEAAAQRLESKGAPAPALPLVLVFLAPAVWGRRR